MPYGPRQKCGAKVYEGGTYLICGIRKPKYLGLGSQSRLESFSKCRWRRRLGRASKCIGGGVWWYVCLRPSKKAHCDKLTMLTFIHTYFCDPRSYWSLLKAYKATKLVSHVVDTITFAALIHVLDCQCLFHHGGFGPDLPQSILTLQAAPLLVIVPEKSKGLACPTGGTKTCMFRRL